MWSSQFDSDLDDCEKICHKSRLNGGNEELYITVPLHYSINKHLRLFFDAREAMLHWYLYNQYAIVAPSLCIHEEPNFRTEKSDNCICHHWIRHASLACSSGSSLSSLNSSKIRKQPLFFEKKKENITEALSVLSGNNLGNNPDLFSNSKDISGEPAGDNQETSISEPAEDIDQPNNHVMDFEEVVEYEVDDPNPTTASFSCQVNKRPKKRSRMPPKRKPSERQAKRQKRDQTQEDAMTAAISAAVTAKVLEMAYCLNPVRKDPTLLRWMSSNRKKQQVNPHTVCHTTHKLLAFQAKTCLILAPAILKT
uniref:Uncharacterized protein n=1 Tax=Mytilus galloprovincialis TaxID=29158 RepID=A0A8B6BM42_MYTGA|nr:Hypothetical predicted protein [Mytilus galloprovincialis]